MFVINLILKTRLKNAILYVLLLLTTGSLLSGCSQERVYRVGILSGLDYVVSITDGFKEQMAALGYIEGKNITYDFQHSNVNFEEYDKILNKFNEDRVDLILCYPTEAALAAKEATKKSQIPVVFAFTNIEGNNIIRSIREPGGNVTGVRYPGPGIAIRRFEIIQELAPQAKRLLIPYQKGAPTVPAQMELLIPAAEKAGVTLVKAPAADAAELAEILRTKEVADDPGFDAILFLAEPLTVTPDAFAVISDFAAKRKIPVGGALISNDRYTTIFGVNVDTIASGKQAAILADKILKGAQVSTLPVISAEIFLQINYQIAQEISIPVNEGLLSQAHEIIR